MTDEDIFNHLFEVAAHSKDPRGVVSACLVEDGKIMASEPSSDDGIYHAEDILFDNVEKNNLPLSKNTILYATLEPCTKRSKPGMIDCTSLIIKSGIGKVVFGARDPDHSEIGKQRLNDAGIETVQVGNPEIVKKCAELFNKTVAEELIGTEVKLKPTE